MTAEMSPFTMQYYSLFWSIALFSLCVRADDYPSSASNASLLAPADPRFAGGAGLHTPLLSHTRVVVGDSDVEDTGCNDPCPEHTFPCQESCTCIALEQRCDGIAHCARLEDELGCGAARAREPCEARDNRTRCANSDLCILTAWLCDGDNDCGDFSDETHCSDAEICKEDQFTCANGLCLPQSWTCDGDDDCRDGSDEHNCNVSCGSGQWMCKGGECINSHWHCDRQADCPDNSDELQCPPDLNQCADSELHCYSGRCVRKEFQCDGDNDCGDWSDEDGCPMLPGTCNDGEFKCSDGKCIPERWRCDTERDCADGGDELNCDAQATRNCTADEHACQDKRCILKTWVCDGVRDCTNGEDEMNCTVKCEEDQYLCRSQDRQLTSAFRSCVNRKHVCDGMVDCPLGDDEEKCPTRRSCTKADKCEGNCITTFDNRSACACSLGYLLADDGYSCRDIDECMYEQDPVCSQTCTNTLGSFSCGCMTGYVLRPDRRSCKPTGGSPTLLFSNRIGIRQVWLTGENYVSVVKGLHNAVALDYHHEKGLVFWTENNLRAIRVSQINTNNITDVIRWGLETPGGVAVDWIHDLLFWTDSGTRRVEVSTLDGSRRSVLAANDLDKPRAIAVHPGEALVFWTDWGPNPKIERADMDGSRRKSVIVDQIFWPNGLTIDYTEAKIYWADAKHHVIERADFDGRDRKKVTNKGLPHPFALTLFEDAVYWTDWHTKSIAACNKRTGAGVHTVHTSLNVPMDIHSYHPLRQLSTYKNRCGLNNGGCSHLCLPNAESRSCRCPVGYNLHSDGLKCEETPEKLLLYARRKDIRIKQLNPRKPTDALDMVIPVDSIKSAVALDWDHRTSSVFWTDVERDTINRAYLNGSHQTVLVSTNLISPAGLAYDWLTDKLYWTDAGTNRIEVAKSDGSMRALLAWDRIDKPRDIVVNPKGGVMYWSDWGVAPCIERADMDGGRRRRLLTGGMTWPNGLALDLAAGRIYWTDGGNKTIEYANLDGTGRRILIGSHLPHPFGLDLHGDEVLWTDWDTQSIQAANKLTGARRRTLGAGVAGLMDVRVFHADRDPANLHNPCANNGGCSHLCLLLPNGHSCACPIGIKLNKDLRTCAAEPKQYIVFAHRVDIRVVSLDLPYLVDVVLPLPPLKNALGVDVDHKTDMVYWSDTLERKIKRAGLWGRSGKVARGEPVVDRGLHTADCLALDTAGRKLYWTDGGRNSIEVAELDGSHRKVLVWTGLDSPRAIALHYERGYMFWSDWGQTAKIERADMDGKNRRVIVEINIKWPNGLAIDKAEGRLYWNDAKRLTIESSDLQGTDRRTVLNGVPYPYGLAVLGSHIYWTDWKTKALHRANKSDGSGIVEIRGKLEGLMNIRAVQKEDETENACGTNNGGCSHLCLRNPQGYSCACPTGLLFQNQTDPNAKICKQYPDHFLVFATRGSLDMISLDTPEMWDVSLPIKDIQNSIAVDFHWDYRQIFFTDVNADLIRSINMSDMSVARTVVSTRLDTPNGLAVDWVADNLYWSDNVHKVIEVARLDGSSRKVLLRNLVEPRSIALFPAKGYLFWSDWGEKPAIERVYLDGSARKVIVSSDLGLPNGLSVDSRARRLYWTDALKNRVEVAGLDGQHRVQLIPDAKNPFGLTMFKGYIYWTDWLRKAVMRAHKTGKNITSIRTDFEMAMEIRAIGAEQQGGWSPCREDNGHCSHLCLYRQHDYVCACPDEPDHRTCSTTPTELVPLKMPSHYPAWFDYDDVSMPPTAPPASSLPATIAIVAVVVLLLLAVAVAAFVYVRWSKTRGGELKEEYREGSGHISFHNPNYGHAESRNRLHGIFKYDKNQERVTNVYLPEGASLLPPPTAPRPPPHRSSPLPPAPPPPPHRSAHVDFEPVTLHTFA